MGNFQLIGLLFLMFQISIKTIDANVFQTKAVGCPQISYSAQQHAEIPEEFDARNKWPDCISIVRDQSGCGSCWAQVSTGLLADRMCISTGKKVKSLLSPQYLVDCSDDCKESAPDQCNKGCKYGYMDLALQYLVSDGVVQDSCYKYRANVGKCPGKCDNGSPIANQTIFKATSCQTYSSIKDFQYDIMTNGPAIATFNLYEEFKRDYKSGVYIRSSDRIVEGHAARVVGWGTENGVPYWLAANSWGTSFGINGYFKIRRGTNEAGFESGFIGAVPNLDSTSPAHLILGLKIMKDVINEFNDSVGDHLSATQHRNLSISLRDNVLYRFFTISVEVLNASLTPEMKKQRDTALDLSYACLSFEFIKTTSIDSSDEIPTVQFPNNWRPSFEDQNTVNLYFNIYKQYHSTKALECLLQIVSVRRSLFVNDDERVKFLSNIIKGTHEILKSNIGFMYPENHHVFSRIIERLKINYHLTSLVTIPYYQEWISSLSNFTIETLKNPQFSPNSIYYLLSLWAKLVSSITYIKGDPAKTSLDKFTPAIMEAFINSKIEGTSFTDDDDEFLLDYDKMVEILENIPHFGRLTYKATCNQIIQFFDHIVQKFQVEGNPSNLEILERQCSWLVYIVGCLISGRTSVNSSEENDNLDGDLAVRVFRLIGVSDNKLQGERNYLERKSRVTLELSFIYFMQNFRKIYIGENSISSSKIYKHISSINGQTDHTTVLFSIIQKTSLDMFWETVNGHSTSRILLESKVTQDILKTHSSEVFPFLDKNTNSRNRSTLYKAIGKLLFSEENIGLFDDFVAPFYVTIKKLLEVDDSSFRTEEIKKVIIGLFRDLRGIVTSADNKRSFSLFFEWIEPIFKDILIKVIKNWVDVPEVTTPVLKFVSEYAFNRYSRLIFPSSSPNGFLIFKSTSSVIVEYGSLILKHNFSKTDLYKYKIKGLSICILTLTRCLVGNYCNYGVFELYQDNCFSKMLDTIFQLCLSVTLEELMNFPKVSRTYMSFLESLCNSCTQTILELNSNYFLHIMHSLHRSIDSQDATIASIACQSIDKIISFCYFQSLRKNSKISGHIHRQFIYENPGILLQIADKLIFVTINDDNANQWLLSKPLLPCFVFSKDVLMAIKQKYIQLLASPSIPSEKIESVFTKLMEGIQDNLDNRNKDKFSHNLADFKREIKSLITSNRFF
eukprot:gene5215-6494_t